MGIYCKFSTINVPDPNHVTLSHNSEQCYWSLFHRDYSNVQPEPDGNRSSLSRPAHRTSDLNRDQIHRIYGFSTVINILYFLLFLLMDKLALNWARLRNYLECVAIATIVVKISILKKDSGKPVKLMDCKAFS